MELNNILNELTKLKFENMQYIKEPEKTPTSKEDKISLNINAITIEMSGGRIE